MASNNQINRIRQELIAAGVSAYGLRKTESRYLPKIIHPEEHIGGVVYGRYEAGGAMLIATDRRVIFLDRKPMFTTNEEVTYDVVSGFKINRTGLVNSVTLHTKVKDFTLRYVNNTCAINFKKYLETRRLEGANTTSAPNTIVHTATAPFPFLSKEAIAFLRSQDVAVLSSSDKNGEVHGSVVYYVVDEQYRIYLLTKSETTKARNTIAHPQVALTVFDADKAQTLQLQGTAKIETDDKIKQYIFNQVMKPHKYNSEYRLPPVAWLEAGMFVVIRITPKSGNYSDFAKK